MGCEALYVWDNRSEYDRPTRPLSAPLQHDA